MKATSGRLSNDELAKLAELPTTHWGKSQKQKLLEAARCLLELESALEHIRQHADVHEPPGIFYVKSIDRLREYAGTLGWKGEL